MPRRDKEVARIAPGKGVLGFEEKAHICMQTVKFLGFVLNNGTWALSASWIQAAQGPRVPVIEKELRGVPEDYRILLALGP